MADVAVYSCTGSSRLFFSRPDRRVLRFRPQQQLAYVREFCCQVTSTLCRAMPRTLQVSCPNPASCGRPNALGPHCTSVASRALVMELSMLHFAGSALCLAGLCRSFVTVLPRHPTGPGSNLRHLSPHTAGATGCASSPGSASTSRAPCSPSSTRHRCRQPKWYRHRGEPFDERSAWMRLSARPAPHSSPRRPWHFF